MQKLEQAAETNRNVENKVAAVQERAPLLSKSPRGDEHGDRGGAEKKGEPEHPQRHITGSRIYVTGTGFGDPSALV